MTGAGGVVQRGEGDQPHPEDRCHRCGAPNVSWCAPSPLWNEVMRGGDINGDEAFDGIVCPTCFARIAETQGVAFGWRLSATDVRAELQTVTPSGRRWDDASWLWADKPVHENQFTLNLPGVAR